MIGLKRYLALGAVLAVLSLNGVKGAAVDLTPYAKVEEVGHQFNETLAAYSRMFWAFAKAFTPLPLCGIPLPIEFGCELEEPIPIYLDKLLANSSIPLTGTVLVYPRTVNLTFEGKKFHTYGSILYDPNDNEKNPLKFNWGWTIPWVGVEMHYELEDVMAFGVIPITGSGPLKIGIKNLEFYHWGSMLLNRDPPRFNILPLGFISDYTFERFSLAMTGLLGLDDAFLETLSVLVSNFLFGNISNDIRRILPVVMAAYELTTGSWPIKINRMITANGITEAMVRELIGKPKPQ